MTAVVLGYGSRGTAYSKYAIDNPDELEIVAVAEPGDEKRKYAQTVHNLSDENLFTDWRQIAQMPKIADFVIISTQDKMHYEPAMKFIELGYNILLEKPMAPTAKECKEIVDAAEKKGVKVVVCHVLRFTEFFRTLKEMIDNDVIGEVMSIVHMENVGILHQSHSYVRGNWRNSKESSPMILAKSCHDTDIVQWLIGKKCKQVQSFGTLSYFVHENRPKGAPDYCVDNCPYADTCYFNAIKLYYDDKGNEWFRSIAANHPNPTDEEVMEAIKRGPYGRCVFACDNDVVDHQVTNMEFEGGVTVSFTMNAFNDGGRYIRVFGTKGEIYGDINKGTLEMYEFNEMKASVVDINAMGNMITSGHGGGDTGIMIDIIKYFNDEEQSKSISDIRTSYNNHIIAFAAEEARVSNTIVNVNEFSEKI